MHTVTDHDIHTAKQIARQFDAAIRANESDAAQKAAQAFRALIVSANGDRGEFGSFAPDGAGAAMTGTFAAEDGFMHVHGCNEEYRLALTAHGIENLKKLIEIHRRDSESASSFGGGKEATLAVFPKLFPFPYQIHNDRLSVLNHFLGPKLGF
ncbi:hypothetical protein J4E05_16370 [Thalassospira sp. NFXS8]|uniref:hypothetical protein n=1 Tax=Thalassospira sp. NFXS8 TaxID=2819093 RepID=UPI0032DFA5FD